jgi:hypothetical protein
LIIFDDLAYDKRLMDQNMKEVYLNGRFYHITSFMTMGYLMGMPPMYRSCIDYLFVFKNNKKDNIEILWKHMFSFLSLDDFETIMYNLGQYECLVLDNTYGSNNPDDMLFLYKVDSNKFNQETGAYPRINIDFKIMEPGQWDHYDSLL